MPGGVRVVRWRLGGGGGGGGGAGAWRLRSTGGMASEGVCDDETSWNGVVTR